MLYTNGRLVDEVEILLMEGIHYVIDCYYFESSEALKPSSFEAAQCVTINTAAKNLGARLLYNL